MAGSLRSTPRSLSSNLSSAGSVSRCRRMDWTVPTKSACSSWVREMLTDTGTVGTPAAAHSSSWRQASSSTQVPIWGIRPVSSAIGMNSSGGTSPRSGCGQRIRASRPVIVPPASSSGW